MGVTISFDRHLVSDKLLSVTSSGYTVWKMPDLTFDFTWYKDTKGYRLVPARPLKRRLGQSILDTNPADVQPARIVRKGGALQSYRPIEISGLFRRFIDMCHSDEGVLEFIELYGPLTHDGLRKDGDIVPALIDQAKDMSDVLRGRIIATPLNRLNASIVTSSDGKPRLKVSPACLLDAMWLQLAQTKSVTKFKQCHQCGRSFPISERRADARFCSVKCKTKYHSLKRSR